MKYLKLVLVAVPFILFSCSKGGDTATTPTPTPTPTPVAEADIAFKVEIDTKEVDYSSIIAALSATQAINVNVTSTLPKDGVTIDVSTKKNADNTVVSSSSASSTTGATNAASVTSLAPGVLCTVTVTVTSKTKSSNSSTKTFQIAAK
jgi:hypothetical protein